MCTSQSSLRYSLKRTRSGVQKLKATERCTFILIIQILTASTAFAQAPIVPSPQPEKTSTYVVDGLALGARIEPESLPYRGYQCTPSEQFSNFTRCIRTEKQETFGSRWPVQLTTSIMHNRDGIAVYINRHIAPLPFDRIDFQNAINKLSSKFGERAREMRMSHREGLPNAIIALWGKIQLEQLDVDAASMLASGQSPRKGLLVDYLGDLRRSAQLAAPIYSLGGGAGYLWSASVDRNGRGHIRFLTIDSTALLTQPLQGEIAENKQIAPEERRTDAPASPMEAEEVKAGTAEVIVASAESAKVDEAIFQQTAKARTSVIDVVAADQGSFDAFLARLKSGLARAEFGTQDMESLENLATVGLISLAVLFVPALLIVWKWRPRRQSIPSSAIKLVTARPQDVQSQSAGQNDLSDQMSAVSSEVTSAALNVEEAGNKQSSAALVTNLKPCFHCSRKISENDKFCMFCGSALRSEGLAGLLRFCSSCGTEIAASARFCRSCGASCIAVAVPSTAFSSEGHDEIVKEVRPTRKRRAKKKAAGARDASSEVQEPQRSIEMNGDASPRGIA